MDSIAYYSKKCEYDGIKFDSETERDFYIKLKRFKNLCRIKGFAMQVPFNLQEDFLDFRGGKVEDINYIADFVITLNSDEEIIVDTKGSKNTTEESARIKQKLLMYKDRELKIYFIAKLPKFLGDTWVDISKGYDFSGKLRNKYTRLNGKWKHGKPNWDVEDWKEYFEFEDVAGLFYIWKATKKVKKKKE